MPLLQNDSFYTTEINEKREDSGELKTLADY